MYGIEFYALPSFQKNVQFVKIPLNVLVGE